MQFLIRERDLNVELPVWHVGLEKHVETLEFLGILICLLFRIQDVLVSRCDTEDFLVFKGPGCILGSHGRKILAQVHIEAVLRDLTSDHYSHLTKPIISVDIGIDWIGFYELERRERNLEILDEQVLRLQLLGVLVAAFGL